MHNIKKKKKNNGVFKMITSCYNNFKIIDLTTILIKLSYNAHVL